MPALDKSSYISSSESNCTCLPCHYQDVFHLVMCMSRDCVCTWTPTHLRLVVWRATGVCFETWVIYIWFRCAVWTSVPVVERLDIRLMYRCYHSVIVGRGFRPYRERIFFTQNVQFQSLLPQNIFSKIWIEFLSFTEMGSRDQKAAFPETYVVNYFSLCTPKNVF